MFPSKGGSNPNINKRIDEVWSILTLEYYSTLKRKEILKHASYNIDET